MSAVATEPIDALERSPSWRVGDVVIDATRRELRRDGSAVPVQPRVFDLIVHLLVHRDRVVPREELLDEVWGTRYVADSTLNGRIRTARRVLGDAGDEQAVIRTLHGRGYRFVGEVLLEDDPFAAARADPEPERPASPPPVSPVRPTTAAAPASGWPLIGRADTIDEIDALFASATCGGVVLDGPDGVGTTSTALAAAERLAARGTPVASCRGLDGATGLPLSGLAHLIDADVLVSAHPAADLARTDVLHKATTALGRLAGNDVRLVLVVDDVHHLDAMSATVIASSVERRSVFAVVAARRSAVGPPRAVSLLTRIQSFRTFRLEPLSAIQVDVLLYRALGGPVDARSLQAIADASGGRPGDVRDLVDRARAADLLRFDNGVWRLVGPVPRRSPPPWPIPDLSDGAVRAAEIIAVAGEIDVAVLGELCATDDIDELDDRRLLTVHDRPGGLAVELVDELASAVVGSIGELRLRRLRRDVVARLVALSPDDAGTLAAVLDCVTTHDAELVVDRRHACEVARRALEDGHTDRAVRLIDRMHDWADPDAALLRAETALDRSQWELADTLLAVAADAPLAAAWRATAITVGADLDFFSHALHDRALELLAGHDGVPAGEVDRAVARRVWFLSEQGEVTALELELDRPVDWTIARSAEWRLATAAHAALTGRFRAALAVIERLDASDANLSNRQFDAALALRCQVLQQLGRADEARDLARAAIDRCSTTALGLVPIVGAVLELEAGRPRAARVLLDALTVSSHTRRHPHLAPVAMLAAGVVELVLGHHTRGRDMLAEAATEMHRVPSRTRWAGALLAASVLRVDDASQARHMVRSVVDEAHRRGAVVPEAEGLILLSTFDERDTEVRERIAELAGGFDGPRWAAIADAREMCTPSP